MLFRWKGVANWKWFRTRFCLTLAKLRLNNNNKFIQYYHFVKLNLRKWCYNGVVYVINCFFRLSNTWETKLAVSLLICESALLKRKKKLAGARIPLSSGLREARDFFRLDKTRVLNVLNIFKNVPGYSTS